MKNYEKHIRFENIELTLNHEHPKDISRVHFQLIENLSTIHQTKNYATVTSHSIKWNSPIEFIYNAQESLHFQTICEHEYGYQIEDLKALYSGEIKIKPEDFFITNHFPIFNKETKKCGQVSFIIKIVDREVGVKYNEEDPVDNQERIKVDLVARISFLEATLIISPLYIKDYEGKKAFSTKFNLIIELGNIKIIAKQKENNKWIFKEENKVELLEKSPEKFKIKIQNDEQTMLSGELEVETLLKNKRFLTHNIVVFNEKGLKIGKIKLELRVIEKKEILDLMYSPKKLENINMEKTDFEIDISRIKENFENKSISSEPVLNMKKKYSLDAKSKDSTFFMKLSREKSSESTSGSKISKNEKEELFKEESNFYFKNRYQEMKFPQSKRFIDIKPNNPYISYTGQENESDFSSKNKRKGADFSKTERTDFTKPYKNHPGIGDYHLPSIWERT